MVREPVMRERTSSRRAHRAWTWLDDRLGARDILRLGREKQIPLHRHTFWYYFGGMALFLFSLQVLTGILLLLYYRPDADHAYESVQFLMTEVEFGWLFRSIHAWGANVMIAVVFIHLFSVLLLKAYRTPRELTWVSGVLLFGLALAFGFTGYLLPWNTLSFFATQVGTEIPKAVPYAGDFIRRFLRGGDQVSGATLTRFYGIHVAILPAITTVCLALHVFLVQRQGMSVPLGVERERRPRRTLPFFPNYLLRDAIGWLSALAALAALAAFFPTELGDKANPFSSAPAGIRPEWYFVAMFETLKLLPSHVLGMEGETAGVLGFGLLALLLLAVPWLDRRAAAGQRSRLVTWIAILFIAYLVVFTGMSYLGGWRA